MTNFVLGNTLLNRANFQFVTIRRRPLTNEQRIIQEFDEGLARDAELRRNPLSVQEKNRRIIDARNRGLTRKQTRREVMPSSDADRLNAQGRQMSVNEKRIISDFDAVTEANNQARRNPPTPKQRAKSLIDSDRAIEGGRQVPTRTVSSLPVNNTQPSLQQFLSTQPRRQVVLGTEVPINPSSSIRQPPRQIPIDLGEAPVVNPTRTVKTRRKRTVGSVPVQQQLAPQQAVNQRQSLPKPILKPKPVGVNNAQDTLKEITNNALPTTTPKPILKPRRQVSTNMDYINPSRRGVRNRWSSLGKYGTIGLGGLALGSMLL